MKSTAGLMVVMAFVFAATAHGQAGADKQKSALKFRFFWPASNSFRVELPAEPTIHRLVPTKEDPEPSFEDVQWLEFFNGDDRAKSVYIYVLSETTPLEIFEAEVDTAKRTSKTLDDEVSGFLLVAGGDDHKVLKSRNFSMNGHKARDVVYRHVSSDELYGRLLAVELPGRVVVMIYSRALGDLKEEERIFNSFTIPSK
jgi:hypothetical protein